MNVHRPSLVAAVVFACLVGDGALAATLKIPMSSVNAQGIDKAIGSITAADTAGGLKLTPALRSLPPGTHGFHVHDNPSCEALPDPDKGGAMTPALGAGGHFDPAKTGRHDGPEGMGHKGDLPVLVVAANGKATQPVLAPHLKVSDLSGHAVMVHAGGDNYADEPAKLGGGGARIACGVAP